MGGKQLFIKSIDCGIDRCGLDQDIVAVSIILHHSYDAPDLSFNTFQTVDQLLLLLLGTCSVFLTAAGTGFFFSHRLSLLSLSKYPHGVFALHGTIYTLMGYLSIPVRKKFLYLPSDNRTAEGSAVLWDRQD